MMLATVMMAALQRPRLPALACGPLGRGARLPVVPPRTLADPLAMSGVAARIRRVT
jgi:hypothetical protein